MHVLRRRSYAIGSSRKRGYSSAESPKVIGRALDAGMQPLSMLMDRLASRGMRQPRGALRRYPRLHGPADVLERLTGFRLTRGVLCAMRRPQLPEVEDLLADARRVAVLEGIVDHTNVGAIFRSAAALDVDARSRDPHLLRSAVSSRPFGSRWERCSRFPGHASGTTRTIGHKPASRRLHELGFKTAAFALDDDSVSLDDAGLNAEDRLALVFGTEGDGLTSSTIARCDYTVRIPMAHGVDSLNVAAASAVAFWQLCR